jgi:hypothetical protein
MLGLLFTCLFVSKNTNNVGKVKETSIHLE